VSDQEPLRARIPADVDRPDKIMFGLTARQLLILTVAGLLLYVAWSALLPVVPAPLLAAASIPLAAVAFGVAVGRRDGIGLDAWLVAAIRHRRSPRRLVPATGEELVPAPAWVATTGGSGEGLALPAPLRLPARGITPEGTVDLGPDGHAAMVGCQTVNFALRSPAEQNALAAGFGRWLRSLDVPAQILVRAQRVDLTSYAHHILHAAPGLPDPTLEQAARDHAAFLIELAAERELLHRQVTVVLRDRRGPQHALRRAAEAARALAACEIPARVLSAAEVAAALGDSLDPTHQHHRQEIR
jgi:hypothetical protein